MKYKLPAMLTDDELIDALAVFPKYVKGDTDSKAERLIRLTDLYSIFFPTAMAMEIYGKLYLALYNSIGKKETIEMSRQKNSNYRGLKLGAEHNNIIGGSDSFSILGVSGIGKSTAINRAIEIIGKGKIIDSGNSKIIPYVLVQCPFDCSAKGLLLSILQKVDLQIGTLYYSNAIRAHATTDILLLSVAQVSINHIGVLVIDEIQNCIQNKYGRNLIGLLTQLINSSGISICMVGTPQCKELLESELQLARRSIGLSYSAMTYGDEFDLLCSTLLKYNYTKNEIKDNTEYYDTIITDIPAWAIKGAYSIIFE